MTERLTELLHAEADHLDVPHPPTVAVLAEGRRLRRRRHVATGLAAAAAVLVVGGSAAALGTLLPGDGRSDTAPAAPSGPAPVAYGLGSQVVVGDTVATVPDTVHSLHYTSEGVLVRSNPNGGASDGSGPETLTLVRPDGATEALGTVPEGYGPATDPDESVYVLAEARGDGFVAVVRDVETGETIDEVPLPDVAPGFWDVPPLALDGETLFVGSSSRAAAVDLETGEHAMLESIPAGPPDVQGGRTVVLSFGAEMEGRVIDARTGEVLLEEDLSQFANMDLSPDGRVALVTHRGRSTAHDLDTGAERSFEGSTWGWTADGDLFRVKGETLERCDTRSGECSESTAPVPVPGNQVPQLGGRTYES